MYKVLCFMEDCDVTQYKPDYIEMLSIGWEQDMNAWKEELSVNRRKNRRRVYEGFINR